MDINAPDFAESFKKEDARVGIIGQGFVGGALKAYFDTHEVPVIAYDKNKPGFAPLDEVVGKADIIFVCVPTPSRKTGECYTGIPEEVLDEIEAKAKELGRPTSTFVVCLKSTVPAGFTERMRKAHPNLRIVFSPEYLMERTAVQDMLTQTRVVVGGAWEDARIVLQFFAEADADRVNSGECVLVQCTPSAAEMAKLMANGLLFTKVIFANEIYQMCQRLGISYEETRFVTSLDPRIGSSHTQVPGPDGFMGAGGHCFPKDMQNLRFEAAKLGFDEKLFTAVFERNLELRDDKDWEKMTDRAVTDK